MDSSKGPDDHRLRAEVAGLHRRVLAGLPPVVLVTEDHPTEPIRLIVASHRRERRCSIQLVFALTGIPAFVMMTLTADEHVVGDVVEVAAEAKPGPSL